MRILALPGDGIDPEITAAALDVLRAADAAFGLFGTIGTRAFGSKVASLLPGFRL